MSGEKAPETWATECLAVLLGFARSAESSPIVDAWLEDHHRRLCVQFKSRFSEEVKTRCYPIESYSDPGNGVSPYIGASIIDTNVMEDAQ